LRHKAAAKGRPEGVARRSPGAAAAGAADRTSAEAEAAAEVVVTQASIRVTPAVVAALAQTPATAAAAGMPAA